MPTDNQLGPLRVCDLNIRFSIGDTHFHIIDSYDRMLFQPFKKHAHPFYKLHYICEGSGTLVTDHGSFALQKGSVYLIPPHMQHAHFPDQNSTPDHPHAHLKKFHISFDIQCNNEKDPIYSAITSGGFWIGRDNHDMSGIYDRIKAELSDKEPGICYSLRILFSEIFIAYMRDALLFKKKESLPGTKDEKRLFMIDEAFLYHYATITLPMLAEYLNLSINRTHCFIKKQYGMSFAQLRTVYRLNAAAVFLASTDDAISVISDKVGFANPIYFTEKFKEQFEMTPSAYRKSSRKQ